MDINDVKDILRTHKLKITPIRKKIFELFVDSYIPLSAEDVMKKLKTGDSNDVTVYRTLASFESIGILRQVDLRRGVVCYELSSHHHHHIVCTRCGVIEDFEICVVEKVAETIIKKSKKFKSINEHAFELFGVCHLCSKKYA